MCIDIHYSMNQRIRLRSYSIRTDSSIHHRSKYYMSYVKEPHRSCITRSAMLTLPYNDPDSIAYLATRNICQSVWTCDTSRSIRRSVRTADLSRSSSSLAGSGRSPPTAAPDSPSLPLLRRKQPHRCNRGTRF